MRVLQRFGDTVVVEAEAPLEPSAEVSQFIRTTAVDPLVEAPADVRDEDLALLAFRLRQTEGFRRSKLKRATEGDEWGEIFERM